MKRDFKIGQFVKYKTNSDDRIFQIKEMFEDSGRTLCNFYGEKYMTFGHRANVNDLKPIKNIIGMDIIAPLPNFFITPKKEKVIIYYTPNVDNLSTRDYNTHIIIKISRETSEKTKNYINGCGLQRFKIGKIAVDSKTDFESAIHYMIKNKI